MRVDLGVVLRILMSSEVSLTCRSDLSRLFRHQPSVEELSVASSSEYMFTHCYIFVNVSTLEQNKYDTTVTYEKPISLILISLFSVVFI